MFFTELLHGHSAARLCSDSFGPLVCFRVGRLLLDENVAHDTTMQHRPAFQEEAVHETLTENLLTSGAPQAIGNKSRTNWEQTTEGHP